MQKTGEYNSNNAFIYSGSTGSAAAASFTRTPCVRFPNFKVM